MAQIPYLSRQAVVTNNNTFVGSVVGFTRIGGVASIIGSMTIRLRGGLNQAGPFFVNSTWSVNSGVSVLDAPNNVSWLAIDAR